MVCDQLNPGNRPSAEGSEYLTHPELNKPLPVEQSRILVIDDDPVFRAIIVKMGGVLGLRVDAIESMLDLDPFSKINEYQAAIIDYYLGQHDGMDLITQLRPFFASIPTLLVSADSSVALKCQRELMPGICEFAPKTMGAFKILEIVKDLIARHSSN